MAIEIPNRQNQPSGKRAASNPVPKTDKAQIQAQPIAVTPSPLGGLGAAMTGVGDAITARQKAIQKGEAAIQTKREKNFIRARSIEFEQLLEDKRLELSTGDDPDREATMSEFMNAKAAEMKSQFTGSADGAEDFEFRLLEVMGNAIDGVSVDAVESRNAQRDGQVKFKLNKFLSDPNNKGDFANKVTQWTEQYLQDFDSDSTRAQQQKDLQFSREIIARESFDDLMNANNLDQVELLLQNPSFQLSFNKRESYNSLVTRFEKKNVGIEQAENRLAQIQAIANRVIPLDEGETHSRLDLHYAASLLDKGSLGAAPSMSMSEMVADFEAQHNRKPNEAEKLVMQGIAKKLDKNNIILGKDATLTTSEGNFITTGRTTEEIAQNLEALGLSEKTKENSLVDETGNVKPQATKRLEDIVKTRLGGVVDATGNLVIADDKAREFATRVLPVAEAFLRAGTARGTAEAVSLALASMDPKDWPETNDLLSLITDNEEAETETELSPEQKQSQLEDFSNFATSESVEKMKAEDATGLVSGAQSIIADTIGQVFDGAVDAKVVEARFNAALLSREFIRVQMLNQRFAVAEQDVLRGILSGPSAFKSPEAFKVRVATFLSQSEERMSLIKSELMRKQNNPNIPKEDKVQLVKDYESYKQLRRTLKKFDLRPGGPGVKQPNSADEFNSLSRSEKEKFRKAQNKNSLGKMDPDLKKSLHDFSTGKVTEKLPKNFPPGARVGEPKKDGFDKATEIIKEDFPNVNSDPEAVAVMTDKEFEEFKKTAKPDEMSEDVRQVFESRLKEKKTLK